MNQQPVNVGRLTDGDPAAFVQQMDARWADINWRFGLDCPPDGDSDDAPATALDADISPPMMGALDAQRGELPAPHGDLAAYMSGYYAALDEMERERAAKPANTSTKRILTDAEIAAESDDYARYFWENN
jgi:hypothetical protein